MTKRSLLVGAVAATANAACTDSLQTLLTNNLWLAYSSQESVAAACANDDLKTDLTALYDECKADATVVEVIPNLVDLLSRAVCLKEKEVFCLPSLLSHIPFNSLKAAGGSLTDADLDFEFNSYGIKKDACGDAMLDICSQKIGKAAVEMARDRSVANNFNATKGVNSISLKVVTAMRKTCALIEGGCKKPDADFKQDDRGDVTCPDASLTACQRAVLSASAVRKPLATKACQLTRKKVGSFQLKLKNVKHAYYAANEEKVKVWWKEDIAFAVHGLLPDDITLTVTKDETDETVIVEVLVEANADSASTVMAMPNAFKKALNSETKDLVVFPKSDALMPAEAFVDPVKLTAGDASVEAVVEEEREDTSSAVGPTHGAALFVTMVLALTL
jgi:NACalpha-BTF3-like transcription factor